VRQRSVQTRHELHDNHDGMSECGDAYQSDDVRMTVLLQRVSLLQECQFHLVSELLTTCLHGDRETRRPHTTTKHFTELTLDTTTTDVLTTTTSNPLDITSNNH